MFKLKDKAILIISNEPWGDIWYSKHNWAYELSQNNNVFFINPPLRWAFRDLFIKKIASKNYTNTLKIINYNNRLPFTRFELIFRLNELIVAKTIKRWLELNKINNRIFWSFDPYRFSNPNLFSVSKSIFFRVDKFRVPDRERILLENVDGLIVTAKVLLKGTISKQHLILSHGISEEEFTHTNDIKYEEGYFLYVGNIDSRLDIVLLEKLLIEFPEKKFLFIGKKANATNEIFENIFYKNKYENIIIHGIEHFKNLKNYIYKSKVCLAPMDMSIDGNEIHHHKSLQYLAMGKPILSPLFNDKINNDEHILGYVSINEAIQILRDIDVSETQEKAENRIKFAKQFLYSNLIKKVEDFLN